MHSLTIDPTKKHSLSPYLYMQFMEPLGTADASVDAAWDYLNHQWEPRFVKLIQRMAPPMLRWGGCFASYYHWKEAVGPRNQRIPMHNLCWDGIFLNQVGTAEFVELCRLAKSEPLMCINMESDGRPTWANPLPGMDRLGTAKEAAEWVEYCNDPDNKLRKKHGFKRPLTINYWQIGNETSYNYCEATGNRKPVHDGFNSAQNAKIAKKFAKEMRKADKNLKLIAWGDDGYHKDLCEEAGDLIDLVAFHNHWVFHPGNNGIVLCDKFYKQNPETVWQVLMSAAGQINTKLSEMKEAVKPYGKRLAMTEGHFVICDGRDRGDVLSSWAAGVAYAKNLNTLSRYSDVLDIATCADFCGNRWQNNAMMLPTPVHAGKPYLLPVGEVMTLFSAHTGTFAADACCKNKEIDVTASIKGKKLFLHIVNTNPHFAAELPIAVTGKQIKSATAWEITADPWKEISQLDPECFLPQKRTIDPMHYTLPPAGVAAIELELV